MWQGLILGQDGVHPDRESCLAPAWAASGDPRRVWDCSPGQGSVRPVRVFCRGPVSVRPGLGYFPGPGWAASVVQLLVWACFPGQGLVFRDLA